MTTREKFIGTMKFDTRISPPLYEFGYWAATIRRWYSEGLPSKEGVSENLRSGDCVWESIDLGPQCDDLRRVITFDKPIQKIPFNGWIYPEFEPQVVEEKEECLIIIDEMGVKKRIKREQDSIPEYIDWPVKDRNSWEKFKEERLNPDTLGRYPNNLEEILDHMKDRDYPLMLTYTPVGFFGSLRLLLGEIRLMTGYYDSPDLIKEIIDYLADFWIQIWDPILSKIKPDCTFMWEDMAYKTGPLISPDIFREFMLPALKKTTSFLKENGVDTVLLDTDGNCWELIPLFLEGGVAGLHPMEVAAGMDVVKVRKCFPKLQIMGGIDKRAIAKGRQAIDKELDNKIPFMMEKGRYIPFIDHLVPPDVSFSDFVYYRKKIEELTQK